jgi:hypothetical protein
MMIAFIRKRKQHPLVKKKDKQRIVYFILKSIMTPCNFVDRNKNFGRTHCLHLKGRRATTNKEEIYSSETLIPIYTKLHDVTSQKTVLDFITRIYLRENLK